MPIVILNLATGSNKGLIGLIQTAKQTIDLFPQMSWINISSDILYF